METKIFTGVIARGQFPNAAIFGADDTAIVKDIRETLSELGTPVSYFDLERHIIDVDRGDFGNPKTLAEKLNKVLKEHRAAHLNNNSVLILNVSGWFKRAFTPVPTLVMIRNYFSTGGAGVIMVCPEATMASKFPAFVLNRVVSIQV